MSDLDKVLQKARDTYGNKNQILVCIEELNELACVLAKYPRYDNEEEAVLELYDRVLDEVADVYIILEHTEAIFNMSTTDILNRIKLKIERLNRWLLHSSSMQETIDDRKIQAYCANCQRNTDRTDETYDSYCRPCLQAQSTEGKAPFYV